MTVFLALVFHTFAVSAQNDPCGDFFKFACSENNQGKSDGTGSAYETDQLRRKLNSAIAGELPQVRSDFDTLLANRDDLQQQISNDAGCWFNKTTGCDAYNEGVNELKEYFSSQVSYSYGENVNYKTSAERAKTSSTRALPISTFQLFERDPQIQQMMSAVTQRVDQRLVAVEQRNYVKDILFPEVREAMKKALESLPEGSQKRQIMRTLDNVTIRTEHCLGSENILMPNANYEDGPPKVINACIGDLFRANSLYNIANLLAHELAHSIDPLKPLGTRSTFTPLMQCLHRHRSLGLSVDAPGMIEAFCDWMGYEVMSKLTNISGHPLNRNTTETAIGLANAFPYCEFANVRSRRSSEASHPRERDRVEMASSHPVLRQRMGCTNHPQQSYCPLNGLPPGSEVPPPHDKNGVAQ